jgi:hypothetical protein
MKVRVSQHIDKSDLNENGFYDYYYDFNIYAFSEGEVTYYARSYNDEPNEAHFTNGERGGKVFYLSKADFKTDLCIEACLYLQASAWQRLRYLGKKGYVPAIVVQTPFKPLLICLNNFHSSVDENAFFSSLNVIVGVTRFTRKPYGLLVDIDMAIFGEQSLRDMVALHHRYGLNMQALRMFETPENHTWFRDKNAYWYGAIFELMQITEDK